MAETTGSATISIAASPDDVYALVSDIGRMADFSPEVQGGEWVPGHGPEPGGRFIGHNAIGDFKWDVECEVTSAVPGKEFAWKAPHDDVNAAMWRYTIAAEGDGTRLTGAFSAPNLVNPDHPSGKVPGRHAALVEAIQATVAKIKETAES